ncbi:unnamed protein product [Cylindrotheca closterium]|uniref:Peptidase A2 domain-containing protein n=2 Tax=Cylindrotheca closterium TaxID=2856 RepID=A0AAD2CXS3_9STRA|nr:unnamed protein product [Cylindrotheca closterium]
MRTGPDHNTTESDEFIARALAEQEAEEHERAEALRRRQSNNNTNTTVLQYPGDRLRQQQQQQQPYQSYAPQRGYPSGGHNYQAPPPQPPTYAQPPPAYSAPPTLQHAPQQQPPPPPLAFGGMSRQRTPMCHIPCVVGPNSVCVEMMVDTGAESSVISEQLAKELGLQIDRRAQGIAAGVGQARIVGQVRDAVVTLGHVEFLMEFMVLQVPTRRLLLLGLDQMRKYKCIVNLEKDVLIFGGGGGVEVSMLPPDPQRHLMVPGVGGGCNIS